MKRVGLLHAVHVLALLFVTGFVPQPEAPRNQAQRHTWIGDVHRGYGRLAEAEADYRKALSVDPQHFAARQGLGRVLDLMDRHAEAQKEFVIALESSDQNRASSVLLDLVASYAFERKFADARQALVRLERIWTRRRWHGEGVTAMLFQIALAEGNLEAAEQHAQALGERARKPVATEKSELLRRATADLELGARLAVVAARRGHREAALEHLKRIQAALRSVLSKVPEVLQSYEEIPSYAMPAGEVAYLLGDDHAAVRLLSSLRSNPPQVRLTLGQAYERLGDRVGARAQYQSIIENHAHGLELALARPIAQSRLAAMEK